jgi:hypothetical protein
MAPDPQPLHAREPSHSGRLLLRMPQDLHAELAARSEAQGVSLNQFIISALTGATSEPARRSGQAVTDGRMSRALRLSLIVNAVVVALAAATSILVLIFGWR